jgi:5-methylcytosine-specific restriction endonuclease McrA
LSKQKPIKDTQHAWTIILKSDEYKLWKRRVRKKYGYTCAHCGEGKYSRKNRLECHHIKPKSLFRKSILREENGLLLCKKCHIEEHKKMREEHPEYNDMEHISLSSLKTLIKSLHFKEYNRRRYTRRKRVKS